MQRPSRALFLGALILALSACLSEAPEVQDPPAATVPETSELTGACAGNTSFQIGSGIYDVTGPAAELGMMGYAMIDQKTAGIHQRLRARAFVIASPCNG